MTGAPSLFDDIDDDPSDETLDDIHIRHQDVASTVLYNTDWTIETLLGQVDKRNIDLTPKFQRRDAWTVKRKSQFVESIILNFPVPPLTLAEKGRSKTYIVVDGKQRITSLAQFFGRMVGSTNNSFRLNGLEQLDELNGLNWDGLLERFPRFATSLENYSIRTNVIRGWQQDDVLYSIFLRLNSGSVKLSPQELRQALKPGSFSDFVLEYAENSPALRSIFPGQEPDFRMRDIEMLIRYIGMKLFLSEYRGQLKKFLDAVSGTLNDEWEKYEDKVASACELFETAFAANYEVFGPNRFNKWSDGRWENRLNRAVFDIQMFYIDGPDTAKNYVAMGGDIRELFCALCEADPDFRSSIETTTKSIEAVHYRLSSYGDILVGLGIAKASVSLTAERVLVHG